MAGTAVISTIKHDVSGAAPTFRDGAGNEIGRLVRAWVNYNGVAQTVNGSFNVSSVTYSSTGIYYPTYSTALPDSTYSVSVTTAYTGSTWVIPSGNPGSTTQGAIALPRYDAAVYVNSNPVSFAAFR